MEAERIDPDAAHWVAPELMPGETLVWAGRPQRRTWPLSALWITGFSLFWLVLTLPMLVGVFNLPGEADSGEVLGLIPRLIAGAFMAVFPAVGVFMLGTGIVQLLSPGRERYALTDRRGLVVSPGVPWVPGGGHRVASLSPDALLNSEKRGNTSIGSISFGGSGKPFSAFASNPWRPPLDTFRKIAALARVEALIHSTFAPKRAV